jgi:hypothetical protein
MITRTRCLFYEVAGVFYRNLAEAQKADLLKILPPDQKGAELAEWLLANSEAVATILTTTPRSRARKPRSDKGKPHKKKNPNELAKADPIPA